MLARIQKQYPDQVRIVYRHFPLNSIHDKAALAAQAAEAAGKQDQFWKMHDLLFSRRNEWGSLAPEAFRDWLERQAASLKLDVDAFMKDLDDPQIIKEVQAAWDKYSVILAGTPYLLINGEPYEGPISSKDISDTVALMLLYQKQYPECPPFKIDTDKQYLAVIETEKGEITLELFPDLAPLAVNNFIFLAREGWYDGVTFHRVIPGFMAQAGDPSGTGFGGPGYAFDNETSYLQFDGPGVVGMANAGPGSNGSQFFITYAAASHLNGGFTIFGRLLEGMDVLENLTPRNPDAGDSLVPGDKILHITIIEK